METTKLTSKGQLVIPKRIRDALKIDSGTVFKVSTEGTRIILELPRVKDRKSSDWPGVNPKQVKLSDKALCEPVQLGPDDDFH